MILGTCSRWIIIPVATLMTLSCGSKLPARCVISRLPSGTTLTRTQPNRYHVCVCDISYAELFRSADYLGVDGDRLSVTFSSQVPGARLPNPQLLALHAACTRVIHMSGAAGFFDEL